MDIELAWAAGFFDGEGNIRWCKTKQPKSRRHQREYGWVVLQIGQLDRRPLDRFCAAVGLGKVYGAYTNNAGTKYYHYQCGGAVAVVVFEKLSTFLSPIKLQQGAPVIAAWEAQKARPKSKYDKYANQ